MQGTIIGAGAIIGVGAIVGAGIGDGAFSAAPIVGSSDGAFSVAAPIVGPAIKFVLLKLFANIIRGFLSACRPLLSGFGSAFLCRKGTILCGGPWISLGNLIGTLNGALGVDAMMIWK